MHKLNDINMHRFMSCIIEMNEFLNLFPGSYDIEKLDYKELGGIWLNYIPTSWDNNANVQIFEFYPDNYKKTIFLFERIETAKNIHKYVVKVYKTRTPVHMTTSMVKLGNPIEEDLPF